MSKTIMKVPLFNLKHTISCGQNFAWSADDDFYYRVFNDKIIRVRQDKNNLIIDTKLPKTKSKKFLKWQFRLDDNLSRIYSAINKDKVIGNAIKQFCGLRVMREEPFECLISYVCSANSNVNNIKSMYDNLCKRFGRNVVDKSITAYSFPMPKKIAHASLSELKKCKLGFRARYVKEIARRIAEKEFDLVGLRKMRYEEAKEKLMVLPGVGNKIADCVLLFAFDRLEAFPVDVWIRRIITDRYENKIRKRLRRKDFSYSDISGFARNYFGKYAGYAQEYLFYYGRIQREVEK